MDEPEVSVEVQQERMIAELVCENDALQREVAQLRAQVAAAQAARPPAPCVLSAWDREDSDATWVDRAAEAWLLRLAEAMNRRQARRGPLQIFHTTDSTGQCLAGCPRCQEDADAEAGGSGSDGG